MCKTLPMMKHTSKFVFPITLVTVVAIAFSVFRMRQAMTAEQILARMAEVYAGCKSYRDTGTVKSTAVKDTFNRSIDGTFTTAFIRPDRFRFEFKGTMGTRLPSGEVRSVEMHYIAWRKGQEISTWYNRRPGIEKAESLSMAIAAVAGISGGSATINAEMLLPEELKGSVLLTDMTEVTRIGDAVVNEVDCYCITGKWVDRATTIWIDRKTFLVRGIIWKADAGDGMTIESTTSWEPAIGKEISEDELDFKAP